MGLAFQAGHRRIWRQVLTSEVANPIGMRIAGKDDGIADLVFVQVIEHSVAVGAVAVPGILMVNGTEQGVVICKIRCLQRPL